MPNPPLFPLFISLAGSPCLLVGGGRVALRKAEKLLPFGPALTVVAPMIEPALAALPGVTLYPRRYQPADLDGQRLVIAATGDKGVDHAISAACRARGIPVNVVDDPAACTFFFPALVGQGALSVGISTGGASPTAAQWVKRQIKGVLPDHLDEILVWLEGERPAIKADLADRPEAVRARVFAALFEGALAVGRPLRQAERDEIIQKECGE